MFLNVYHALSGLDKRQRRKRLVAILGGQTAIARLAHVNRATVCRVVAGWDGGHAAARVEQVILQQLRECAHGLEALWNA